MTVTIAPAGSWGIATCTGGASEVSRILALPGSWPIGLQPQCFVRNDQWTAALTPPGPPVAGYIAWWDASAITGLADGAALTTWPDGSGNGHDLTQATGSAKPVYKTTAMNGHPATQWTAANPSYMNIVATWTVPQPLTFVVVCKNNDSVSPSQIFYDVSMGTNFLRGNATSHPWHSYAGSHYDSTLAPGSTAHFVALGWSGAASKIRQDGTTDGPFDTGTFAFNGVLRIGATNAAANGWDGLISEMIVYPSLLSDANLTSLRSYAQSKWGTP